MSVHIPVSVATFEEMVFSYEQAIDDLGNYIPMSDHVWCFIGDQSLAGIRHRMDNGNDVIWWTISTSAYLPVPYVERFMWGKKIAAPPSEILGDIQRLNT